MTRVWYCGTCGYEVDSGGRCHNCGRLLILLPFDELREDGPEEELGYRLVGWTDHARAELIVALINDQIPHRFDSGELVVTASSEETVDALLTELDGSAPQVSTSRRPVAAARDRVGPATPRHG